MSLPMALLFLFLVALSAVDTSASPLRRDTSSKASINIAARLGAGGLEGIAKFDRDRAKAMKHVGNNGKRDNNPLPMNFTSIDYGAVYTTTIGVGSPATEYTVIVDTASAITWVGGQSSNPYEPTNSSVSTTRGLNFQYGTNTFSGVEYLDTVTFSCGLAINNTGIGVAHNVSGFRHVDGVFGVGPNTLSSYRTSDGAIIPNLVDDLYNQNLIQTDALGVYFIPLPASKPTGEIMFGGADISKTTSAVNYVALTDVYPASAYWGIDLSITYGEATILTHTAGIVDTGSTLIMVASNAFQQYQAATGAIMDQNTGMLMITADQYSRLSTLTFTISGEAYELVPSAQIWPRALNSVLGGSSDCIYLVVSDIGDNSGTGLDFILGFAMLQRYYTVFDTTHKEFGIAHTKYTYADLE